MFRVLIVDDEMEVLQNITQAINWEQYGFSTVIHASSADEALMTIRKNPIDLVITDIRMPGKDGLWLVQQIRHIKPHMAIVVLTAHSDFDLVKQALRLGTVNYLLKPIDVKELSATVREIAGSLRHTQMRNTNVFRDTILERWLRGQISVTELDERAQMTGINTFFSYYNVILLSSIHLSNTTFAYLMDQFNTVGSVYSLMLHEQYYAFIIGSNQLRTEELHQILDECLTDTEILHAIGCCAEDCESLHLSFEDAKAVLSNSIAQSKTDFFKMRAKSPIVQKGLTYIQERFMMPITLKQFCEKEHVNNAYFGRLFHEENGIYFAEAVARQRIEHSAKLLIDTDMTVQEIAVVSGFSGSGNMIKVFQKYMGMSPKQYRIKERNRRADE